MKHPDKSRYVFVFCNIAIALTYTMILFFDLREKFFAALLQIIIK